MKPGLRLYITGNGLDIKWVMAYSIVEATEKLGAPARVPDPDELRIFWVKSGIAKLSDKERLAKFGVSRQTFTNWRHKAGTDLRTRPMMLKQERRAKLMEIIDSIGILPISKMKEVTGLGFSILRKLAKEMNLTFPPGQQPLTDDELVELAKGKTWLEFANATGLKLPVLRQRVYADPILAARVREVRKAIKRDRSKSGRVRKCIPKIKAMGLKGMSAYRIAEVLGIEMMSVRYHLKKMAKERPDEFYAPYGNKRKAGNSVDGSDGGIADHE